MLSIDHHAPKPFTDEPALTDRFDATVPEGNGRGDPDDPRDIVGRLHRQELRFLNAQNRPLEPHWLQGYDEQGCMTTVKVNFVTLVDNSR